MESIYLVGSDEVRSAASRIANAAEEMQRAAGRISDVYFQHERFLERWLGDLQTILQEHALKDFVVDITPTHGGYEIKIHRAGPSSNGKTPALQAGDLGSTPSGSTTSDLT